MSGICEKLSAEWNGLSEVQKILVASVISIILTLVVLVHFTDLSFEGLAASAVGGASKVGKNLRLVEENI